MISIENYAKIILKKKCISGKKIGKNFAQGIVLTLEKSKYPFFNGGYRRSGRKYPRGTWSTDNTDRQTEISITSKIYHQVHSMIIIGTYISQWILKITRGDPSEILIGKRKLNQDKKGSAKVALKFVWFLGNTAISR